MNNKTNILILRVAKVLSGISVFVGIGALIIEKIILPFAMENFSNLYAPLPYSYMVQSLFEYIMVNIFYTNFKKNNIKVLIISVLAISISMILAQFPIRILKSENGIGIINYEYRELYSLIFVIVYNIEKFMNLISLTIVLLFLCKMMVDILKLKHQSGF